jgi:putative spermidine/putrescine transport system permease protein
MTSVANEPVATVPIRRLRLPASWPLWPLVLFLGLFFLFPLVQFLAISLQSGEGEFSFEHFERIFSRPIYLLILTNTLKIAGAASLLCVLLGYPVAYLLARASGKLRSSLLIFVLVPLWTSFLVRAIAWMIILGHNGILNSVARALGLSDTALIYNFTGVMIGSVHTLLPVAILMMLSVMLGIDANLGKAAATLGARPSQTFWRVYFPLSLPGVVAAALVTFINAAGFFVVSQLLGGPRDIMIAQLIVQQLEQTFDWEFAAALGAVLIAVTLLVFYLFDRVLGFATLAGEARKGPQPRRAASLSRRVGVWLAAAISTFSGAMGEGIDRLRTLLPGRPRPAGLGKGRFTPWIGGAVLFFVAVPALILIPASFTESSYLSWPPVGFSLQWYEAYFGNASWMDATWTSIVIALWTAALAMLIGVPAAFVLARQSVPGKRLVLAGMVLPIIVPQIVVAVGLYYLFTQLGIVKTMLGVVLGHTVFAVPYVAITMLAVLRNYDHRLDQAAWTLGAGRLQTFFRITLPVLAAGFVSAFLFAFLQSFDELTVSLFIADSSMPTLPRKLWAASLFNIEPGLAAVATVMLLLVIVILAGAALFQGLSNRRRLARSR